MKMFKGVTARGSVAAVISFITISSVMGCMYALTQIDIPEQNKDLFNMGFGAMIGWAGAGVHFFLGSSKGSKDKTEAMATEMAQDGK